MMVPMEGKRGKHRARMQRHASLAAVFLLTCCAAPAIAGEGAKTHVDTTGSGSSCGPDECTLTIRVTVTSAKNKCVAGRKVRFYALYADDKVRFDTDRAHWDGLAMGYGAVPSTAEGYLIKVEASKAGETRCKPTKISVR